MAGLFESIQDLMNPHVPFVILVPERGTAGRLEQKAKQVIKRAKATTWGWQVTESTIAFRVYKPHHYAARGLLEEAGFKFVH